MLPEKPLHVDEWELALRGAVSFLGCSGRPVGRKKHGKGGCGSLRPTQAEAHVAARARVAGQGPFGQNLHARPAGCGQILQNLIAHRRRASADAPEIHLPTTCIRFDRRESPEADR